MSEELPEDPFEPDLSELESLGPDWQAAGAEFARAGRDLDALLGAESAQAAWQIVMTLDELRARLVLLRLVFGLERERKSLEEWDKWWR